jgi:putative membrane protein
MAPELWDDGLQNERTRLAWVRTATTLAAGGLGAAGLALRGRPEPLLAAAFALAALFGGILLARTGVRYLRVQRSLHEGLPLDHRADALLAWLGVLAVAAGAVVFVIVRLPW